jgi:DNA segregation ATPase FtsK/SpoIIIE-like protein
MAVANFAPDPKWNSLLTSQYRSLKVKAEQAHPQDVGNRQTYLYQLLWQCAQVNNQAHGLNLEWQKLVFSQIEDADRQTNVITLAAASNHPEIETPREPIARTPDEKALLDALRLVRGVPLPRSVRVIESPTVYRCELELEFDPAHLRVFEDEKVHRTIARSLYQTTGGKIDASMGCIRSESEAGNTVLDFVKTASHRRTIRFDQRISTHFLEQNRGKFLFVPGVDPDNNLVSLDRRQPSQQSICGAGASGSGKTNLLRCQIVLAHLLFQPSEIEILVSDPHSTLTRFEGLPILHNRPIATDAYGTIAQMFYLISEFERREKLFDGAADIEEYNSEAGLNGLPKLPIIWGIFDELDETLETIGSDNASCFEVYRCLAGLSSDETPFDMANWFKKKNATVAKGGRKFGISVDWWCQYPTAEVLPVGAKSQSVRFSLFVTDAVSSQVILDRKDAKHLLGDGDGLLLGRRGLRRTQSLFVAPDDRYYQEAIASARQGKHLVRPRAKYTPIPKVAIAPVNTPPPKPPELDELDLIDQHALYEQFLSLFDQSSKSELIKLLGFTGAKYTPVGIPIFDYFDYFRKNNGTPR